MPFLHYDLILPVTVGVPGNDTLPPVPLPSVRRSYFSCWAPTGSKLACMHMCMCC